MDGWGVASQLNDKQTTPRSCVGDPTRLHSGRGRIKWGTHFGFAINHVFCWCVCVCGWVVLLSRPSELFPVAFSRVGGRVIPRLWGVGIHFSFALSRNSDALLTSASGTEPIWKLDALMMKNTESPSVSSLCWPRAPSPRDDTHRRSTPPPPPTSWVGPLPARALIDTNMRSLHNTRPRRCVSQTALASPREVARLSSSHINNLSRRKKVPASVVGRCWLEHTHTHTYGYEPGEGSM